MDNDQRKKVSEYNRNMKKFTLHSAEAMKFAHKLGINYYEHIASVNRDKATSQLSGKKLKKNQVDWPVGMRKCYDEKGMFQVQDLRDFLQDDPAYSELKPSAYSSAINRYYTKKVLVRSKASNGYAYGFSQ